MPTTPVGRIPRRTFLTTTSAAAASSLLASRVRAESANAKLRTAHIGVGGMGQSDLNSVASHPQVEVAAVCDVDLAMLQKAQQRFPNAKTYRDYRELFADLGDKIDAAVVSTPDHTHAPAAMMSLTHGKPVYCQKPLTHEVFEARQLRLVAADKKLPTQMGIQVHGHADYRLATRLIQDGAIGKVSRVLAWSNKNWGYDGGEFNREDPVPETLDWNLWLGVAAQRPYVKGKYHRGTWRKLVDFGTGTLGDMGVHIFDTPYRALKLTAPKWARTTCRAPTGVGHPEKNVVEYEFPGTEYTTESLLWTWFDGAEAPPKETGVELPEGLPKLPGQGSLFVGEGGVMLLPHVDQPVLLPEKKFRDYKRPDVGAVNHYHQWVDACLGQGSPDAHFGYAGPLTEALLLGVVANRFPGQKLQWNADSLTVTNSPEATKLISREYREGFEVPNLSSGRA